MPRLDKWSRLERMLRFLIASGEPEIFATLSLRGFDNEARRGGFDLFFAATGAKVDVHLPPARTGPGISADALDRFEKEWFGVVSAALRRFFPELHASVFQGLRKSSGMPVVLTVNALLDRVGALEEQGEQGQAALALLARRGFTPEVRAQGRELIKRIQNPGPLQVPTVDEAAEAERVEAEDAMWAWYQDWAQTARTIVRRKDLRIRLGLSQRSKADAEDPMVEPVPAEVPRVG